MPRKLVFETIYDKIEHIESAHPLRYAREHGTPEDVQNVLAANLDREKAKV